MSGPSLLVTPVLAPNALSVQGVFPGLADGVKWYDWYNLTEVVAAPGENVTMDAPLTYQPIHVRGGSVIPLQKAGNTTKTSRQSPWSLLIALDEDAEAEGELYLDDGISLSPNATKNVYFSYANSMLVAKVNGSYTDSLSLANVTIAGYGSVAPSSISISLGGKNVEAQGVQLQIMNDALYVTGLETVTKDGIWNQDVMFSFGGSGQSATKTTTASGTSKYGSGWPTTLTESWNGHAGSSGGWPSVTQTGGQGW